MFEVIEKNTGTKFYIENLEELKEHELMFLGIEEFVEKFEKPEFVFPDKTIVDIVKTKTEEYILQKYPLIKQQSDQADREYYVTLLRTKGVKNIEATVVEKVEAIYSGKSLEEVLADIPEENRDAFEQLIKAGVRVSFVQLNKKAAREAIANKTIEVNFVPMPEL